MTDPRKCPLASIESYVFLSKDRNVGAIHDKYPHACAALPGIPPVTRIGVIDWTAGALLSASPLTWPKIDGAPDRYRLLWQIEQGSSS